MSHPALPGHHLEYGAGLVRILCAECGHTIRALGGRLQHQRGRRDPITGEHRPLIASRLEWEELEALSLCECGQFLDSHPPLPRRRPLSSGRGARRLLSGYSMFNLPNTGNG